jgi:tetratricopeptide (TPR) repeat protein
MDAFRKAMATDPQEPAIPKMLGWTLMSKSEFEDAISVWQDYMKAHPDDDDGPANLGSCFVQLKRYPEAAEAYEASLKISKNPALRQARLGSVYLLAGERDKAAMAFGKLADLDPKGSTFNDSAYEMSNADLNLPLALNYATKAVRRVEEESQKTELTDLRMEDLQRVQIVAAYWDTLGWVNERMSNLEEAEQYLRASWKLTQDGVVGGHLCHLYTRTHRTALAIQMCRMAIYRMPMTEQRDLSQFQVEMAAAQENLNNLTGKEAKSRSSVDASGEVIREREFKLPRFLQGTESAEFFVLLASDGKSKAFKV